VSGFVVSSTNFYVKIIGFGSFAHQTHAIVLSYLTWIMRRLDILSGVLATTVERAHKIEIKTVGRINIVVLFVCCYCYAVVRTAAGSQENAEAKSLRVFVCILTIILKGQRYLHTPVWVAHPQRVKDKLFSFYTTLYANYY
jgi:hypothetical protein